MQSVARSPMQPRHKEVGILLRQCGIEEVGGQPKWERMLLALSHRQNQDQCGNNAVAFLCAVLHPSRFGGRLEAFEDFRAKVNYQLSFCGLSINEKGQPQTVLTATTISEGQKRANELQAELLHRNVHPDVLKFCKAELLQDNYFHCILEAAKSVAQKNQEKASVEADGAPVGRSGVLHQDAYLGVEHATNRVGAVGTRRASPTCSRGYLAPSEMWRLMHRRFIGLSIAVMQWTL